MRSDSIKRALRVISLTSLGLLLLLTTLVPTIRWALDAPICEKLSIWSSARAAESIFITDPNEEHFAKSARLTHLILLVATHEMEELQTQLELWKVYPPCVVEDQGKQLAGPLCKDIELVIYLIEGATPSKTENIVQMFNALPERSRVGFSSVRVKVWQMIKRHYHAPYGRQMLFEQLFRGFLNIHRAQYVLYMNVKTLPLRRGWLSILDLSVRWPVPKAWIRSALTRRNAKDMIHFLEDALYYVGDGTFRRFYLDRFHPYYVTRQNATFPEKIMEFLTNDPDYGASIAHMFQPTKLFHVSYGRRDSIEEILLKTNVSVLYRPYRQ